MKAIHIVLADDHTNVRDLVSTRLRREGDIQVVAEAGNSAQSVEYTLAKSPHLLLIDPMMHDGAGLDAVREIAYRRPDTVIVVLTAFSDTAMQMALRKIGVKHILAKGIESSRLIAILREAANANSWPPSPPIVDNSLVSDSDIR